MASPQAIRLVTTSTKALSRTIHLQCHVKPGASKQREGILSVSDSVIELCVSAQAREGEANKAVRELISDVLKVPKSDVEVIKGFKSREKTLAITGIDAKGDGQSCISKVREQLQNAAE